MDVGKKRPIKAERETILLTTEADGVWEIYTFNTRLKNRLRKYAHDYPEECSLESEDSELGCARYFLKKICMSIHLHAPYSEEKRTEARNRAKKQGFGM